MNLKDSTSRVIQSTTVQKSIYIRSTQGDIFVDSCIFNAKKQNQENKFKFSGETWTFCTSTI